MSLAISVKLCGTLVGHTMETAGQQFNQKMDQGLAQRLLICGKIVRIYTGVKGNLGHTGKNGSFGEELESDGNK